MHCNKIKWNKNKIDEWNKFCNLNNLNKFYNSTYYIQDLQLRLYKRECVISPAILSNS